MHPLDAAAPPPALKLAGDTTKVYALSGELYLSSSGWLLLKVPNSLGRGLFAALDETGVELPTRDTDDPEAVYNAHISVCTPEEVEQMGGPEKISERGKHFHYCITQIATVDPTTWSGVSRCWIAIVESPELKEFRKSYGLTPLPKGDWEFHVTFAIRKTGVLGPNEISKTGSIHGRMECSRCEKVIMQCRCPVEEWNTQNHRVVKVVCRACKREAQRGTEDSVDVNTKEGGDGELRRIETELPEQTAAAPVGGAAGGEEGPELLAKTAEGFYQRALFETPLQWNQGVNPFQNLVEHLSRVYNRGQELMTQRGNDLSMLSSLNPALQMQRFHNTLAGKNDVVTDPLDRTINYFTGFKP